VVGAAELGIERRVVADVVPVGAAGSRPQHGRQIQATDAEVLKVVGDAGGLRESEGRLELEPVRAGGIPAGHARRHWRPSAVRRTTVHGPVTASRGGSPAGGGHTAALTSPARL